jgi:thiamine pyrophosphokinase
MRDCILFLHGRYNKEYFLQYRKLCRGRYKIAVDGGYRFFQRTGLSPDMILGDFDSLKQLPKEIPPHIKIITHPENKDKTDSHLALEHCLGEKAKRITIVQPAVGEIDHFLGNTMLLTVAGKYRGRNYYPEVTLLGPGYKAVMLENSRHEIRRGKGSIVSVLPISDKITLNCMGTAYDCQRVTVLRGDTRALRNEITSSRAEFVVRGQAILLQQLPRGIALK